MIVERIGGGLELDSARPGYPQARCHLNHLVRSRTDPLSIVGWNIAISPVACFRSLPFNAPPAEKIHAGFGVPDANRVPSA